MSRFIELRRMRQKKLLNVCSDDLYEIFDPNIYLKEMIDNAPQETNIIKSENQSSQKKGSINYSRTSSQALKDNARSFAALHKTSSQVFISDPNAISSFVDDNQFAREVDFKPFVINGNALYDKNCITCGNENFEVTFHKQRHICHQCKKHLKTPLDDEAIVYMGKNGEIKCYGVKKDKNGSKTHYKNDSNNLKIFGYKCYATFSGSDELILLLDDMQPNLD